MCKKSLTKSNVFLKSGNSNKGGLEILQKSEVLSEMVPKVEPFLATIAFSAHNAGDKQAPHCTL